MPTKPIYTSKAVANEVERVQGRIDALGIKGKRKKCPMCDNETLFPKEINAVNALSRKDGKTYICNLCGSFEFATGVRR